MIIQKRNLVCINEVMFNVISIIIVLKNNVLFKSNNIYKQ